MLVIRLFIRSCQLTSRALLSFSQKSSLDHIQRRREMQNPGRGNHVHKEEDKPLRVTHRCLEERLKKKKLRSPNAMDVRPVMEVVKGPAFDILQLVGG